MDVTPRAKVYTDEFAGYDGITKNFVRKVVNHSREYANEQVHPQGIEDFWEPAEAGIARDVCGS